MARKRIRPTAVFCTVLLTAAGVSLATGLSALAQEVPGVTTDTGIESTTSTWTEVAPTTTASEPPADAEPPPEPLLLRLLRRRRRRLQLCRRPPRPPPLRTSTPLTATVRRAHPARRPSPEIESWWAYPTIWLHRPMADPTPPRRLAIGVRASPSRRLAASGRALVARAGRPSRPGREGSGPGRASRARAGHQARRGQAHEPLQRSVRALERYNGAVGLRGLVVGLQAAKPQLQRRVLADRRIDIYAGGRADVASGGIDVRVLVLLRYLATGFGQVTVSSLHSGHSYWARPGVVSAYMYGLAVDISAVASSPIYGHQGIGSVTESAVSSILRSPTELQPQQIISLMGLGGVSFPSPTTTTTST